MDGSQFVHTRSHQSKSKGPCLCGLGCLLFILVSCGLVWYCTDKISRMNNNIESHRRELDLLLSVKSFWSLLLLDSIRVVDNETDSIDVIVLHRKKNETGQELLPQMLQYRSRNQEKSLLKAAYLVIDRHSQENPHHECVTLLQEEAEEIRCWEMNTFPGTGFKNHGIVKLNRSNGVVEIQETGIYQVFAQLTFNDSESIVKNNTLSSLYMDYPQYSLNIGEMKYRCYHPVITMFKGQGSRLRTCEINWTGPLSEGQKVFIGNTMAQWRIVSKSDFSHWGFVQLQGSNRPSN